MAVYGRTRYSIQFLMNDVVTMTFHSDVPPIKYSPGEYVYTGDWKDQNGNFVMTRDPYRVVRVDHNIDWERSDGGWGVSDRFWTYVYVVRTGRIFQVFEGVKTIVRAFVGGMPKAPARPAVLGGPGPSD